MSRTEKRIKILEKNGWTIERETPLEIRNDQGSFARQEAAEIVIEYYFMLKKEKARKKRIELKKGKE